MTGLVPPCTPRSRRRWTSAWRRSTYHRPRPRPRRHHARGDWISSCCWPSSSPPSGSGSGVAARLVSSPVPAPRPRGRPRTRAARGDRGPRAVASPRDPDRPQLFGAGQRAADHRPPGSRGPGQGAAARDGAGDLLDRSRRAERSADLRRRVRLPPARLSPRRAREPLHLRQGLAQRDLVNDTP